MAKSKRTKRGQQTGTPAGPPVIPVPAAPPVDGDADTSEHAPLAPGVKYRRILLKLSGEALMGGQGYGIDAATLSQIADELCDVQGMGVDVGIVIGGGNIFRG